MIEKLQYMMDLLDLLMDSALTGIWYYAWGSAFVAAIVEMNGIDIEPYIRAYSLGSFLIFISAALIEIAVREIYRETGRYLGLGRPDSSCPGSPND